MFCEGDESHLILSVSLSFLFFPHRRAFVGELLSREIFVLKLNTVLQLFNNSVVSRSCIVPFTYHFRTINNTIRDVYFYKRKPRISADSQLSTLSFSFSVFFSPGVNASLLNVLLINYTPASLYRTRTRGKFARFFFGFFQDSRFPSPSFPVLTPGIELNSSIQNYGVGVPTFFAPSKARGGFRTGLVRSSARSSRGGRRCAANNNKQRFKKCRLSGSIYNGSSAFLRVF